MAFLEAYDRYSGEDFGGDFRAEGEGGVAMVTEKEWSPRPTGATG